MAQVCCFLAQVRKNVADLFHRGPYKGVLRRRRSTTSPTCTKYSPTSAIVSQGEQPLALK